MAQFVGEDINDIARVIFIIIASAEVIVGVVGNIFLLIVLFTSRLINSRNIHNLFVVDLAIADLVTLGYWMTFFVFDLILGYQPVANNAHCVANGFIVSSCSIVGIFSLVTISLNRYLNVCHSRLYHRIFTKKTTIISCVMLWIVAAVMATPPLFVPGWGFYYHTTSHTCTFGKNVYPKTIVVITFFGTTFIVCYFNVAIFRFWKKAKMNIHGHCLADSSEKPRRFWFSFGLTKNEKRKARKNKRFHDGQDNRLQTENETIQIEKVEGFSQKTQFSTEIVLSSRTLTEDSESDTHERSETNELEDFDSAEELESTTNTALDYVDLNEDCGQTDAECASEKVASKQNELPVSQRCTFSQTLYSANIVTLQPPLDRVESKVGLNCGAESALSLDTPKYSKLGLKAAGLKARLASLHPSLNMWKKSKQLNASKNRSSNRKNNPQKSSKRSSGKSRSSYRNQIAHRRQKKQTREQAFVRSLLVICLLMFVCFLPFGVISIVAVYHTLSSETTISLALLLLFNNSVNWIVYGAMNRNFRKEYTRLLKTILNVVCRCRKQREEVTSE